MNLPADPDHPDENTDRFLELATRPLEKSPHEREEARTELHARLARGDGQGLPEAVARLEAAKPPHPGWTGMLLTVAALVLLGAVACWQGKQALQDLASGRALMYISSSPVELRDPLRESLAKEDSEFVFAVIGDDAQVVPQLERQWRLHPGEPGIYEELALRSLAAGRGLPDDFSATWQQADPDNGVWLYLEAVGKSEERQKTGPAAGETWSPEVMDLLKRSVAAPEFHSHIPALRVKRLGMLPATGKVSEEIHLLLYGISAMWEPSIRHQINALRMIDKAAGQHVADGDKEALADLIRTWKALVTRLSRSPTTLLGIVVPASCWNQTGQTLLAAARDLGMAEEEKELAALEHDFRTYAATFRAGARDTRGMSSLAGVLLIGNSVEIDSADVTPGRNAEYAQADRLLGWASAILALLLLLGAGIESIRRGRTVNGLAQGLCPLFRPVDFLWVAGLGVVVPALWYLGLTHLTPAGLRHIGASHFRPYPILIQCGAALIFALLAIVQTAKWRIGKRTGMLGLAPSLPWIGWTMTALAAAVIPATGVVQVLSGNQERFLQGMAAAGGLSLLWLLWEAGSVLFSPRDSALRGVLLCRRMIAPLALLAALPLAGWSPYLANERHWHAQDRLCRVDRSTGGLTTLESRLVRHLCGLIRKSFPE